MTGWCLGALPVRSHSVELGSFTFDTSFHYSEMGMGVRGGVFSIALSFCAGVIAHAQSPSAPLASRSIVLPDLTVIDLPAGQQALQLLQWTHDYQEWRAWYLQWRNRP